MAERREMPVTMPGEQEPQAFMEVPEEEEPTVLAPPGERRQRTIQELEEKARPASLARAELDRRKDILERELRPEREKQRRMRLVLEALEKRAEREDEQERNRLFGLGKYVFPKRTASAHDAVSATREALKAEEKASAPLEAEYESIALQESKLLSAMQPDDAKLQPLRKEASFERTLSDIAEDIRGKKRRGVYHGDADIWFDELRKSRPDKLAEIDALAEQLNKEK